MRLSDDGTLLLSPSDLSAHLACPHLTNLNLRVQRGELERPHVDDTHGDLIRRKGDEHEAAYLGRLLEAGRSIVRIPTYDDDGFDADEARRLTEEAVRAATADVIYQPYLSDGTWRGFADFLERLPDGTYEAVDTKLARSAKPAHVLQLCFYSEQLGRIQGRLPERFHVELGSGERATFRTADHMAYYRRARAVPRGARDDARDNPGRATTAGSATSATCANSSSETTTTSCSSRGCAEARPRTSWSTRSRRSQPSAP